METLTLYDYAASANCYKVRLLLARLGLEHRRVEVDIFAGETLTDEFARINPARTTPVLEVGRGRYLPESGAILLYLAEGSDLLPGDALARAQVVRWLLFEQADVVPAIGGLRFRLLTGRLAADDPRALARRRAAAEVLALLDDHLAAAGFLVDGRFTVADIAVYGYVHVASEAGVDLAPYEAVRAWLARVAAQPSHIDDLAPYPPNAAPGAGRSIYD
jgi:glutathione S-transferase